MSRPHKPALKHGHHQHQNATDTGVTAPGSHPHVTWDEQSLAIQESLRQSHAASSSSSLNSPYDPDGRIAREPKTPYIRWNSETDEVRWKDKIVPAFELEEAINAGQDIALQTPQHTAAAAVSSAPATTPGETSTHTREALLNGGRDDTMDVELQGAETGSVHPGQRPHWTPAQLFETGGWSQRDDGDSRGPGSKGDGKDANTLHGILHITQHPPHYNHGSHHVLLNLEPSEAGSNGTCEGKSNSSLNRAVPLVSPRESPTRERPIAILTSVPQVTTPDKDDEKHERFEKMRSEHYRNMKAAFLRAKELEEEEDEEEMNE